MPTSSRKKMTDVINNITLNWLSHQRFIKKSATMVALTTAMNIATTTFHGAGMLIQVTATVIKVRMKSAVPIPHKNLADEI